MANTILHKKNSSTGVAPTTGQLSLGELAINTFDGTLYLKKNDGGDSIIVVGELVNDLTPQLGANLDVNDFTIVSPDSVGGGDATGVDIIGGTSTARPAGYVKLTGGVSTLDTGGEVALTGGAATSNTGGPINITGGDGSSSAGGGTVNITGGSSASNAGGNVQIQPGSGTGDGTIVLLGPTASAAADLRFYESNNIANQYIALKAPDNTITTSVTYTLPEAPAVSGYVLQSTTAGVMSWAAGGGLADVVDDTSPQLGADLDTNNFTIGDADDDSKISFGTGDSDLIQIFAGSNGANEFLTTNPVFEVRTESAKSGYENTMLIAALDADVTANVNGGGDLTVRGGAGTASDVAGTLTLEAGTPGSGGVPSSIVLTGNNPSGSNAMTITGGKGTGNGCAVNIQGGDAGGTTNSGGAGQLKGGDGGSSSGAGGNIIIDAGDASGGSSDGGKVTIQGGLPNAGGTRGKIVIFSPNGTSGDGGQLTVDSSGPTDATSDGGDITITAAAGGSTGGAGGDITVKAGNANSGNGGQLIIRGGTSVSGTPGHVNVQGDLEIDEALYFDALVANAAATAVDWSDGNIQTSVPTGAITYTFTAPGGPAVLYFVATDLSTQTPTWPATVKWPGGTEPTWTAGKDVITFVYDGTDYLATAVELNVS